MLDPLPILSLLFGAFLFWYFMEMGGGVEVDATYKGRLGGRGRRRINVSLLKYMAMGEGWEVDILDYTLLI